MTKGMDPIEAHRRYVRDLPKMRLHQTEQKREAIERAMSVFDGKEQCPACDGEGGYWDDQTGQPDEPQGGRMLTCEQCEGEGWVIREPCIACGAPITQGSHPWNDDEHDAGCPVVPPTCHLPRWINPDTGQCEHTDHEEVHS